MTEVTRGLLDTSVVVDHDVIDHGLLPDESAISAVTLAELAAGPLAASDDEERAPKIRTAIYTTFVRRLIADCMC